LEASRISPLSLDVLSEIVCALAVRRIEGIQTGGWRLVTSLVERSLCIRKHEIAAMQRGGDNPPWGLTAENGNGRRNAKFLHLREVQFHRTAPLGSVEHI
jgi:hypothetical protein